MTMRVRDTEQCVKLKKINKTKLNYGTLNSYAKAIHLQGNKKGSFRFILNSNKTKKQKKSQFP